MAYDTYRLWEGDVPGALGTQEKDIPTITVYPAKKGTQPRPAMVILPGGGYRFLAQHEGPAYAEFFSENGYTCFEVKYRLGIDGYHYPAMLWDAARAVRWVRAHAGQYEVDPEKIAMIGSSAGGHLLSSLATHFDPGDPNAADPIDRYSSRPTVGVLCYSVVSMVDVPHSPSKPLILGVYPTPEQLHDISPVEHVTEKTPPCFMMHTVEDEKVDVGQSLMFADALHRNGVPFEIHIYEKGKHGIALGNGHPWTVECLRWLNERLG